MFKCRCYLSENSVKVLWRDMVDIFQKYILILVYYQIQFGVRSKKNIKTMIYISQKNEDGRKWVLIKITFVDK